MKHKKPEQIFWADHQDLLTHGLKEKPIAGLGDRIHYIAKAFSADKLAKKIANKFTKSGDCGCNKRRKKLNNLFPAKTKT